jgi:DNA replication protein DnaC
MDRATKRLLKQGERDRRIQALYSQYSELQEVDEAIAANGRAILRATLKPSVGMDKAALGQKQKDLLAKQAQILGRAGLDAAVYDVQWDCPLCEDRGYTSPGVPCSCAIREAAARQQLSSGLAPLQLTQTFDSFSLEWYAQPAHYQQNLMAAQAFAAEVCAKGQPKNLLLYGSVGTGKTHLCSAIANQVLSAGLQVLYFKSSHLFSWLRSQMFDSEPGAKADPLELLYQADLLVLDDLGTEGRTDFVEEQLFNLIDERIIRQKPWVISTNFLIEGLCNRYDERLTDRILGEAKRLRFEETSIRRQKLEK